MSSVSISGVGRARGGVTPAGRTSGIRTAGGSGTARVSKRKPKTKGGDSLGKSGSNRGTTIDAEEGDGLGLGHLGRTFEDNRRRGILNGGTNQQPRTSILGG